MGDLRRLMGLKERYNKEQWNEISLGIKHGVDVEWYAKPEFTYFQMHQIRLGLEAGLDVSSYAKSNISSEIMLERRRRLLKILEEIEVEYEGTLTFASMLKNRRRKQGYTRSKFAEMLKINKYLYENFENDKRYPPKNEEILASIIKVLKLSEKEGKCLLFLACYGRKKFLRNVWEYVYMSIPDKNELIKMATEMELNDIRFEEMLQTYNE